jgi:hypothetical protein
MENFLEKNKPLIHYFLSGFLGKYDNGCPINTVIELLDRYDIYEFNNNELLKIIELNTTVNKYNLTTMKLSTNETSIILQLNDDYKISENYNIKVNDFKKIFNKSIYVLGEDNHATNLLFLINDDDLYILSINSGLGISNHKFKDGYFSPYYCLKINYSDKTKINETVYNILCIINFSILYNKLRNYFGNNYNDIISLAKFLKIHDEIYNLFYNNGVKLKDYDAHTNISNYISDQFYLLFINYLKNTLKLNDESSEFNEILISKNNQNIDNLSNKNLFIKNDDINTNKRLYLKHRLYLIENYIYIHDQENGSCSFYSLYWAILINSLFSESYDSYVEMIKKFEKKMFEQIVIFFKDIKEKDTYYHDYNYSLCSTILNKLSNLNILTKEQIDIHDDYLYNKLFLYDIKKSKKLHKNKSDEYLNSLKFILIPPTDKIKTMFEEKIEPHTEIFLRLYNCFIKTPDIFDISDINNNKKYNNYYTKLKNETTKQLSEHDQQINKKILSAYKKMIKYLEYPPNHLNIYSVQYYYIAKSICEYDFKYDFKHDYIIINFCNFIYKFYLFNELFRTQIFKTLYSYPDIKNKLEYTSRYLLSSLNKNTRKTIITTTLRRMKFKLDFN